MSTNDHSQPLIDPTDDVPETKGSVAVIFYVLYVYFEFNFFSLFNRGIPFPSLLTFIASFEKVALKKVSDSMPNFGLFLSELIVVLFILIFALVVFYKKKRQMKFRQV